MNFQTVLIIGCIMLSIGLVANIAATILEKKYKDKMNSISKK